MAAAEVVEGETGLTEYLAFRDRVYADRAVRWPTLTPLLLPMLQGLGPFAEGRTFRSFLAVEDGVTAARATAVVDERYRAHWGERLGHVILYESLPEARGASRAALDAACGWLREHGADAARAGFGVQEFPFVVDDYHSLPAGFLRHNPPAYHTLLKDAAFEAERGWVDYKIEVTPELVDRWERALAGAQARGFEIVPLARVPEERRLGEFTRTWDEAFWRHWGATPLTEAEFGEFFGPMSAIGMLDTSVLAYKEDAPAGVLWVVPDASVVAETPGRPLRPDERLNFLGIGVLEPHRGTGLNLAMASYAFLELVRRGSRWLSYTLVLDDNWPSRRTGERLGGFVCATYLTYRRTFRH